jgi:DNA-binding winged helix-turn-helix (wHTH) protein/Flp pilus assembly protein TadD
VHYYAFGPFRLWLDDENVTFRGRVLPLGPKPVAVLRLLIERAGTTCTIDDLTARVWPDGYVDKASLSQVVYLLRKTLGEHWAQPVIETVRNKGYRFVAAAVLHAESGPARSVPRRARLRGVAVLACCALVAAISSSTPLTGPSRRDAAATRLYTLGRYYLNSRTHANVVRSVAYFEQVLQREPHSALAYAGLSDANAVLADGDESDRNLALYASRQRAYADRAVLLGPNLSEAHASLAKSREIGGGYSAAAEREFRLAIRLDPGNATAHHWFGVMLMTHADIGQAGREFETAAHLNPTSPSIDVWFGLHRYLTRDYPAAVIAERQALDLDPQNQLASVVLGLAYEQLGAYSDALAAFRKTESLCGCNAPLVNEARVYALIGDRKRAHRLLESVSTDPAAKSAAISMASARLALGDTPGALRWLAESPRANPFVRVWLSYDPRLDAIRGTRRFLEVTRPQ